MTGLLLRWIISVAALLIAANVVPGIGVSGTKAVLMAPLVIGFVNATLGTLLELLSFPITILTLGMSSLVINGLMLMLAAYLVDGFGWTAFSRRSSGASC